MKNTFYSRKNLPCVTEEELLADYRGIVDRYCISGLQPVKVVDVEFPGRDVVIVPLTLYNNLVDPPFPAL